MTQRGLPIVESPVACPFVAFADDRDERATSPDHRHRCYAEATPAPRALAHQEAYCLASAFPVCPTFQDWARREAARAHVDPAPAAGLPIPGLSDERPSGAGEDEDYEPVYEDRPRRAAQKNWASPPPWLNPADPVKGTAAGGAAASGAGAGSAAAGSADRAGSGGGGLSGSFADRLASPPPDGSRQRTPVWRSGDAWDGEVDEPAPVSPDREPEPVAVPASDAAAPVAAAQGPEAPQGPAGRRRRERLDSAPDDRDDDPSDHHRGSQPSWERPARLEAYPSLRSRRMPEVSLPSIALAVIAVLLAAVLLFFLPGLLGIGSSQPGASPTSSPGASAPAASVGPTILAQPTQLIYLVQSGDTMSKIAKKFNVPLQALIDANKTTIPNPDKLKIGDQVIIPTATPTGVPAASASP